MSTTQATLTDFLLARIAEDETEARVVSPTIRGYVSYADGWDARRVARALAECDAKRRIIELHEPRDWDEGVGPDVPKGTPVCTTCGDGEFWSVAHPCDTLRLLALPYAAHPDYLDGWRP